MSQIAQFKFKARSLSLRLATQTYDRIASGEKIFLSQRHNIVWIKVKWHPVTWNTILVIMANIEDLNFYLQLVEMRSINKFLGNNK